MLKETRRSRKLCEVGQGDSRMFANADDVTCDSGPEHMGNLDRAEALVLV